MEFLHRKNEKETKKENQHKVFLYGRVSTKKQAESGNLDRQMMRLTEHDGESGYIIGGMFKEVASEMNENRREPHKLLEACENNKGSIVLIEYKDRLARLGFSYLETHIQSLDCCIEILETTEKIDEEELVEDLIAITTSFSARIYGKRGGKKVKEKVQKILEKGVKET